MTTEIPLQNKAIDTLIEQSDRHLLAATARLIEDVAMPAAKQEIQSANPGLADIAQGIRSFIKFEGDNVQVTYSSSKQGAADGDFFSALNVAVATAQQVLQTLGIELQPTQKGSAPYTIEFKKSDLAEVLSKTLEIDGAVKSPDERRFRIAHAIVENTPGFADKERTKRIVQPAAANVKS